MPSHVILTLSLAGHASFKCGVGTLEASAILALNLAEATLDIFALKQTVGATPKALRTRGRVFSHPVPGDVFPPADPHRVVTLHVIEKAR
jgi:hypothetical protein